MQEQKTWDTKLGVWCAATAIAVALAGCGGARGWRGGPEDAVMLSDNTRLTRTGGAWTAARTGATANVILAHDETRARFTTLASGTTLFDGVAVWRSQSVAASIQLTSSMQQGSATFDGTRYVFRGLVAGSAYAAADMLTVRATIPGSAPVEVTVPAPAPLADPTALLGTPAGLRTEVRVPDGTFDVLFVYAIGSGGTAGDAGAMRLVQASEMTLAGGLRRAPLLDDVAIDELNTRRIGIVNVYVAYMNQRESAAIFPGLRAVPVQAGRMFQIAIADLQ